MEYEYKVIDVADGAIGTVLLGDGRIETAVLEASINAMAMSAVPKKRTSRWSKSIAAA